MPASQASYQPLNGKEIREILKKRTSERIDKIPLMKEGHAYHEATLAFSFTMTATPADCPVPTAEWEDSVRSPDFNLQDHYVSVKDTADSMKNKKEQILAQIEKMQAQVVKIDELLTTVEEIEEVEEIIAAGRVPDNIRIENDLPVPRIVKETSPSGKTTMTEKMINYNEL